MFHSAECQIQCPITPQIKAKGPPPLPLGLIIGDMPQCTSHRKEWICPKKERETHTHVHKRGSIQRGRGTEGGSLKPRLSLPDRVSLLQRADTQRPLSATVKSSRSEHYRNVKINQVQVLLYVCVLARTDNGKTPPNQ